MSSSLQSEIETPWGKTAKYVSFSTDEMLLSRGRVLEADCIWSSSFISRVGMLAVSELSNGKSFSSDSIGTSVSAIAGGRGERLYVGLRLRYLPRSGTKSEFCTLLSVESVDTSGSASGQLVCTSVIVSSETPTNNIK